MAGKVSKAKRPKRRWIGITLPPSIQSKSELMGLLETSHFETFRIKVYDFHPSNTEEALASRSRLELVEEVGFAVVCVLLSEYEDVRKYLQTDNEPGLRSLTSSGKIRLVRERLGLPKPPRR